MEENISSAPQAETFLPVVFNLFASSKDRYVGFFLGQGKKPKIVILGFPTIVLDWDGKKPRLHRESFISEMELDLEGFELNGSSNSMRQEWVKDEEVLIISQEPPEVAKVVKLFNEFRARPEK